MGCLAASLAYIHWMPVATPVVTSKMSKVVKCPLRGRGAKSLPHPKGVGGYTLQICLLLKRVEKKVLLFYIFIKTTVPQIILFPYFVYPLSLCTPTPPPPHRVFTSFHTRTGPLRPSFHLLLVSVLQSLAPIIILRPHSTHSSPLSC